MRYRNYSNFSTFFWIGIILLFLFGGFRIAFFLLVLPIALIINFFPLIFFGFILYTLIKSVRHNSTINDYLRQRTTSHQRFTELLIHILIHVMKADGHVDSREIQTVISFFQSRMNFSYQQIMWVSDLIRESIKHPTSLDELCVEFSGQFNYESKLILMELIYHVAYADQTLSSEEIKIIDTIVSKLGINSYDHLRIKSLFGHKKTDSTQKYYAILGLQKNASKEAIKKAYRDAVKKYHPDKVHHLGPEYKKIAEEKMHSLNEAYDHLMK